MPLHAVQVRLYDKNFQQLKNGIREFGIEPEILAAFNDWRKYYRAFLRDRFVKFSRGGGDWKPLAASTLARRRGGSARSRRVVSKATTRKARKSTSRLAAVAVKAKKKVKRKTFNPSAAILRDTGSMFAAFQPDIVKPASLTNSKDKRGIVVVFGAKRQHPLAKMSQADLMKLHHYGKGRLPARKLVVGPDQATTRRMAKRMEQAFQKIVNRRGK